MVMEMVMEMESALLKLCANSMVETVIGKCRIYWRASNAVSSSVIISDKIAPSSLHNY